VTGTVVLLLTAVVGLPLGTVLLERSNREAQGKILVMVEGQVDFFVNEVSEDLLMNEPGMQPLRYRVLLKVLDDYEKLLKDCPGYPPARQWMARAKRQLGELYLQVGKMAEARALEDQAVKLYEGLLRETPADRETCSDWLTPGMCSPTGRCNPATLVRGSRRLIARSSFWSG
jgi:hypothetical protein